MKCYCGVRKIGTGYHTSQRPPDCAEASLGDDHDDGDASSVLRQSSPFAVWTAHNRKPDGELFVSAMAN